MDQNYANIEVLLQQNTEMKGEVTCLEERIKTIGMEIQMENNLGEMKEFDLRQLLERKKDLEQDINHYVDRGDELYGNLRKEISD